MKQPIPLKIHAQPVDHNDPTGPWEVVQRLARFEAPNAEDRAKGYVAFITAPPAPAKDTKPKKTAKPKPVAAETDDDGLKIGRPHRTTDGKWGAILTGHKSASVGELIRVKTSKNADRGVHEITAIDEKTGPGGAVIVTYSKEGM